MRNMQIKITISMAIIVAVLFLIWTSPMMVTPETSATVASDEKARSYIVQGLDLDTAAARVREVGGKITHELPTINAVGVELTIPQQHELRTLEGVTRIYENHRVKASAHSEVFYE